MTESVEVKNMVESFQKETSGTEDISAFMNDEPKDDLKDKELLNKTMEVVNTGEIVPEDHAVEDPKYSSSYLEMVYERNIAKLKVEMKKEEEKQQREEEAKRKEGRYVKPQQSELSRKVTRTRTLGAEAELPQVNSRTARMSWFRSRVNLNGPAYLRALWRKPMLKYKNLSQEEVTRINKSRTDKVLWNKILQRKEDVVDEKDRPPTEEELKAMRLQNFMRGNFELTRSIPTVLERNLSRHAWGRGLYLDWRNMDPFPYAAAIDSDMSPSTSLIRDKVEYEAWKERDNSDNYILKDKTSAQDNFHEHWKRRCLVAAEEAYKQMLQDKEDKRLLEEQERKRERLEERRVKLKARQLMNQKAAGLNAEGSEDNSHIRLHREVIALKDQLKQHQARGQDGTDNVQAIAEEKQEETKKERRGLKNKDDDEDDDDEVDSESGAGREQQDAQMQLHFPTSKSTTNDRSKKYKDGRTERGTKGKMRRGASDFLCCLGKKDAAKKTAPANNFFDIFDEEAGDKGEGKEEEGGDVVGELPPAEDDFAAKMKQVAKARRQSRRASRVVPFALPAVQEPVEEPPDEGKKKSKYPRKSANKRRRKVSRKNSTEVVEVQDQAAPDDKKWHRKQAKLKRRAEVEALKKQQQEEEERMLAELQKETRLQKALVVGKGFLRVLCCCFMKRNKKNKFADKFSIKSDAELESEKMQQWMTSKRDVLMVETMFTVRSIERESKRRYRAFFRWFGMDTGREFEQSADNLRASCLNGRYKEVLDTLEDGDFNTNTVNSLGDTAFYAVVNRALDGSGGEVDYDDDENTVTIGCWEHVKKKVGSFFKKKAPRGRLDLILKILTVRGGDVNFVRVTKDKFEDGHALVHEAAKWNREGMLEWLVSKDVNVNIFTSRFRKTPLMLAAEAGHGEMVRTLLHRGCIDTIQHADNRGWTALHYAAAFCESQFVKMLLVCGAEMGVRTEANRLPLEEAQSRGRMENVAVLMFHKDRSRMFTHRILYYDQEGTRLQVAAQQEAARQKAQEASGPLGLAGLRNLGSAS